MSCNRLAGGGNCIVGSPSIKSAATTRMTVHASTAMKQIEEGFPESATSCKIQDKVDGAVEIKKYTKGSKREQLGGEGFFIRGALCKPNI